MKYESDASLGTSSASVPPSASAVCAGALAGALVARSQPTELTGPGKPLASSSWCECAKPPKSKLTELPVPNPKSLVCTWVSTASEKTYWSTSCEVPWTYASISTPFKCVPSPSICTRFGIAELEPSSVSTSEATTLPTPPCSAVKPLLNPPSFSQL